MLQESEHRLAQKQRELDAANSTGEQIRGEISNLELRGVRS